MCEATFFHLFHFSVVAVQRLLSCGSISEQNFGSSVNEPLFPRHVLFSHVYLKPRFFGTSFGKGDTNLDIQVRYSPWKTGRQAASLDHVYSHHLQCPSKMPPLSRSPVAPSRYQILLAASARSNRHLVNDIVFKGFNARVRTIVTSRTSNVWGLTVPNNRWNKIECKTPRRTSFVVWRSKIYRIVKNMPGEENRTY